jgi:hypothetical protein
MCACAPVTKPYEFIGFGAMDVTKPSEIIGFGAMDVTKPYEFMRFGAMDVTKPYEFIGFGAMGGLVRPEPAPGLIFVDLCSVFQAGAIGNVPGPNFGQTSAQHRPKPTKTGPRGTKWVRHCSCQRRSETDREPCSDRLPVAVPS